MASEKVIPLRKIIDNLVEKSFREHYEKWFGNPKMDIIVDRDKGAAVPLHGHKYDAGYDLLAPERVIVPAHGEAHIDFGVHFRIPAGFYGHLESKSGLNFNFQLDCPGGIIDCGFTGSVRTVIQNRGPVAHVFEPGNKVVQIIFSPCIYPEFNEVEAFPETERGDSGFGSTGV